MRDAKRALGAKTAHATRLKGATARSVRRFLGAAFPRGSCAFQADAAPSGVSPHGVIFVPHFMRERNGRVSAPLALRNLRTETALFQQGLRGFQGIFFSAGTRLGGEDIPVFVRKAEELPATLKKSPAESSFFTNKGRTSRP